MRLGDRNRFWSTSNKNHSSALTKELWLPDELWIEILEYVPSNQLLRIIPLLSARWNLLTRLVRIPVYGVLVVESQRQRLQQLHRTNNNRYPDNDSQDDDADKPCYPEPLFDIAFGPPSRGSLAIMKRFVTQTAFSDVWFCLHLYPQDLNDYQDLSIALITSKLHGLSISQKFRINWKFAIDLHEYMRYDHDRMMRIVGSQQSFSQESSQLSQSFPYFLFRDPSRSTLDWIPSHVQSLMFWSITQTPDLTSISNFPRIKSLRLEADTLLPDTVGGMLTKVFRPLLEVQDSLETLCLQGPWTHNMQASARVAFGIFSQLHALKSFVADLDMIEHTPAALHSLFTSLPNLSEIGRLGRVDNRFWRLFPKGSASHIKHLILGNRRYFFTGRWTANPEFLSDLGFGVNWAFPDLECLSVSLGFQSEIDTDDLLDIVKVLKDGPARNDPVESSSVSTAHSPTEYAHPNSSSGGNSRRRSNRTTTKSRKRADSSRGNISSTKNANLEDMMESLSISTSISPRSSESKPKPIRNLKRIMFYQASDIDTLHLSKWEYVCSSYSGYPIFLYITTGDSDVAKSDSLGYGNEYHRTFGSYR